MMFEAGQSTTKVSREKVANHVFFATKVGKGNNKKQLYLQINMSTTEVTPSFYEKVLFGASSINKHRTVIYEDC